MLAVGTANAQKDTCGNGIDDDNDGLIDGMDPDAIGCPGNNPTQFACDQFGYYTYGVPQKIQKFDPNNPSSNVLIDTIFGNNTKIVFNATAFNQKDGMIWGLMYNLNLSPVTLPYLVKYGSNNQRIYYNLPGLLSLTPTTNLNSGTIDKNGIYYLTTSNILQDSISRIDLTTNPPTILPKLPVSRDVRNFDFSYNKVDNKLYYVISNDSLGAINLTTGNVEVKFTGGVSYSGFTIGATYVKNDTFYAISNAVKAPIIAIPNLSTLSTYVKISKDSIGISAVGNADALASDYDCPPPLPVLNPDINATYVNVAVTGSVKTNDSVPTGTQYGSPTAVAGNPSASVPTMASDGTYSFTTATAGVYNFMVDVCPPGQTTNCPKTLLTITVLDKTVTTNPPVANTDLATTLINTPVTLKSLANDQPGSATNILDTSSVAITVAPKNGTTSINPATGNITYTPNTGFTGQDTLYYQVCDKQVPSKCDTAMQIITKCLSKCTSRMLLIKNIYNHSIQKKECSRCHQILKYQYHEVQRLVCVQ